MTNEDGIRYFRPDNLPLINLFHTLGIKNLRIGGNTSDRDAKLLPNEADLDSLFAFAKTAGVKVIYCLRLHDGDPQADAVPQNTSWITLCTLNWIAFPSARNRVRIREKNNAHSLGAGMKNINTDRRLEKICGCYHCRRAGREILRPSVHNNADWARKFIADFGKSNHVVLITEHLYPGGAGGKVPTPEIGRDRMLAAADAMTNSFPKAYQKLHDSFVPLAISNGLPYRLEEVNNYFNGGATNVSNTFASALWGLDFMYWWAAHSAAGLNFHTGDKVAAGYTLQPSKYTAFFSTTNGYVIRPLGYGIKAFDLGSHGQFVPITISNPDIST